jgi:predicted amidohydrolase
MPKGELRVTIHQTAPLLGDVEANEEEVRARVWGSEERDLLVFPELSLTGYTLKGRVQRFARPLAGHGPLDLPPGSPPLALGFPERGEDELVYNTAVLTHDGKILARHRKVYLPTYGMFDEKRYYASGKQPPPVATLPSGWKVGLLICEDFWHPALLYLLAIQGAEVILVLAAAPGRGDPSEGEDDLDADTALFSSTASWTLLARTAALQYGVFLVIANRAGVEEGITFAGESTVVGPDGSVLARAPQAAPALLEVAFPRTALRRSRNPYSHLRDEDPDYFRRCLEHLLDSP